MSLSSRAVDDFLFFGIFWSFLALVFGFRGLRDGSLRVAYGGTGLAFRKRTSERIGGGMLGVWIAVGVPIQYGQGLIYAVLRHQSVPAVAYFALLCGILMGGSFGGLVLFLAGPRDLYLDLDRRTYRFVSGWPFCPREQSGPWEDMAGVYVRPGTSRVGPFVEIAWRKQRCSCPLLGRFRSEGRAEALAEEVAAVLGLPRVAPPPLGQTWVAPGSLTVLTKSEARPYRSFRPALFSDSGVPESEARTE